MDCQKIGQLILELRKEKQMTQKQVADLMNISDKTISKWERGLGCPDVSLLRDLAQIFGVSVDHLLAGELKINEQFMPISGRKLRRQSKIAVLSTGTLEI